MSVWKRDQKKKLTYQKFVNVLQKSMETLKGQVNRLESRDAASNTLPMDKKIAEAVTEYRFVSAYIS